jgi:hypothetical protein
MKATYFKNLILTLLILAAWSVLVFKFASKADGDVGLGFALFVGVSITRIASLCGAVLFLLLRMSKLIDRQRNFFYFFFAVTNLLLGIGGVVFYEFNQINREGVHELIANLFVGALLIVDIFLFNVLFKKSESR